MSDDDAVAARRDEVVKRMLATPKPVTKKASKTKKPSATSDASEPGEAPGTGTPER